MNSVHAYKPALFWKLLATMMQVCHITQNWSIVQVLLRRNWHSGPVEESEALEKLSSLAKHGRYKDSIIEDARRQLEAKP